MGCTGTSACDCSRESCVGAWEMRQPVLQRVVDCRAALVALSVAIGTTVLFRVVAVEASHTPSQEYGGVTSELGIVALEITPDGAAIEWLVLEYPEQSVPDGCIAWAYLTNVADGLRISNENVTVAGVLEPVDYSTPEQLNASVSFSGGRATGTWSTTPIGSSCPARDLTFNMVPIDAGGRATGGATYQGTTGTGGAVSLTFSSDGSAVTAFRLATDLPCSTLDLGGGGMTAEFSGGAALVTGSKGNAMGSYVVAASGGAARGAFAVKSTDPGCPTVTGYFTANVGGTAATATPTTVATAAPTAGAATSATPATGGTGTIVSGSIPASGGFGLIVFGGGSSAQLLAASGCPAGTAAFWATNASGDFDGYVPGTTIAVVNAAWNARFAAGIPANTPLIGKCR
jgi:hypothetical protein